MKDFNLKVVVRNNRLLRMIEDRYPSQKAFSRATGYVYTALNAYMCFRERPVGADGDWRPSAVDLATALNVMPSEIWPEHLQEVRLKTATATLELSMGEVQQIQEDGGFSQKDLKTVSNKLMESLTPRSERIIRMIHLQDRPRTEVADEMNLSRARLHQIERKALERMKQVAKQFRTNRIHQVVDKT